MEVNCNTKKHFAKYDTNAIIVCKSCGNFKLLGTICDNDKPKFEVKIIW
jgi:ribosomal protein L32